MANCTFSVIMLKKVENTLSDMPLEKMAFKAYNKAMI